MKDEVLRAPRPIALTAPSPLVGQRFLPAAPLPTPSGAPSALDDWSDETTEVTVEFDGSKGAKGDVR